MVDIEFHNRSGEPVYDVVSHITSANGITTTHRIRELMPSPEPQRYAVDVGVELPKHLPRTILDVYFIDARGQSWHRHPRGWIEQLDPGQVAVVPASTD